MDYYGLVSSASFFMVLVGLDKAFALGIKAGGCKHCRGPLHQANFMRKGFGYGLPADAADAARVRYSFCCGSDGCRKRMTPSSLRFLPREPYLAVTIIMIAAFNYGLTDERLT